MADGYAENSLISAKCRSGRAYKRACNVLVFQKIEMTCYKVMENSI